jgi:hypothetical protein
MVQLFLVDQEQSRLVPLYPTTSFRTNVNEGGFFLEPVQVAVPGMSPGSEVMLIVRGWIDGDKYEAAYYQGESAPIVVTLGGTNTAGDVIPLPSLEGLESFQISLLTPPPFAFFDSISQTTDRTTITLFDNRDSVLEASSDLSTWSAVLTNPPITAPVILTNSPPLKSQFFRIRLPSQ